MVWHGLAERMEQLNPQTKKTNAALNAQGQEGERIALQELEAIRKETQDALKEHLDEMRTLGGIQKAAEELREQAKQKGLTGQQSLDWQQAQLATLLGAALGQRGFKPPKGVDVGLDKTLQDTARGVVKAEQKQGAAAEARGQKKDWATELAEAKDDLDAEIKEAEEQTKAEAKRLMMRLGKGALEAFQEGLAASPEADPEASRGRAWRSSRHSSAARCTSRGREPRRPASRGPGRFRGGTHATATDPATGGQARSQAEAQSQARRRGPSPRRKRRRRGQRSRKTTSAIADDRPDPRGQGVQANAAGPSLAAAFQRSRRGRQSRAR